MKKMAHIVIKVGQICHFLYIIAHKTQKSYETMTKKCKNFFIFCFLFFVFLICKKFATLSLHFLKKIIFSFFAKILRFRAAIFERILPLRANSACRRVASGRDTPARVTRDAVFHGFTTAVILRGLSPADECAS